MLVSRVCLFVCFLSNLAPSSQVEDFSSKNGDRFAALYGHDIGFYCIALDTGLQRISTFDMNKSWAFDKKK